MENGQIMNKTCETHSQVGKAEHFTVGLSLHSLTGDFVRIQCNLMVDDAHDYGLIMTCGNSPIMHLSREMVAFV